MSNWWYHEKFSSTGISGGQMQPQPRILGDWWIFRSISNVECFLHSHVWIGDDDDDDDDDDDETFNLKLLNC